MSRLTGRQHAQVSDVVLTLPVANTLTSLLLFPLTSCHRARVKSREEIVFLYHLNLNTQVPEMQDVEGPKSIAPPYRSNR